MEASQTPTSVPPVIESTQTPQQNHKNSEILKIIIAALCFVLGGGQILLGIMLLILIVPQLKALQESAGLTTATNFYFVYACLFVTIILGCIIIFLGYRILKLKLRLMHAVITLIVVFILQGIIAGIIVSSIIFPIYKTVYEVNNNSISVSPTLTVIPTENWNTYEGDGFSLQYPNTWTELTEETNNTNALIKSKKIFTGDTCISGGCGGFHSGIYVYLEKNPNSYNAQDYFQKVVIPAQNGCGDVQEVYKDQNLLGNNDAIIAEGFCGAGTPGPSAYIAKDNYVIVLASDGIDKKTAFQIFSTFKFTTPTSMSPTNMVNNFYSGYVDCEQKRNAAASAGSTPVKCDSYRTSPVLSSEIQSKIAQAKFIDQILCAQNMPKSIKTDEAKMSGNTASTTVHTYYESSGDNPITIELANKNNNWLITDIICKQ